MGYHRIIYVSTATINFQEADLLQLLELGRNVSDEASITGILVYSEGRFMQVLEGHQSDIRTVFAFIMADLRHGRFEILDDSPIDQRDFPDWQMSFTTPLGDYLHLPNFTPLFNIPATGPIRQLLHEFLAEREAPIK